MKRLDKETYLGELKRRAKTSRISRPFQLIGLEIAVTLRDLEHKALYIKLAKEHDPQRLLQMAKEVAERRDVKNAGAYFMKLASSMQKNIPKKP
jgi:hypothetical protein